MPIRLTLLIALLTSLCLPVAQARDQMSAASAASPGPASMRADAPLRGSVDAQRVRQVSDADMQQQELLQRQKRRDDLREMLRVRSDDGVIPQRQLSAQEKMELRQQLRQQQEWSNK